MSLGKGKLALNFFEVVVQESSAALEGVTHQSLAVQVQQVEGKHAHLHFDVILLHVLHTLHPYQYYQLITYKMFNDDHAKYHKKFRNLIFIRRNTEGISLSVTTNEVSHKST